MNYGFLLSINTLINKKINTFVENLDLPLDLVSIIVPIYNTSAYLEKCLQSLQSQEYRDIEVILVDDGSTDNSLEIIKNWASKDARFQYFSQENGGLSAARNAGINLAKGQYLAFVDSDDWVEKNFISEMMDCAQKWNADIVFCNLQKVNEEGEVFKKLPQSASDKSQKISDFLYFGEISWFACNKLFKSDLFRNIKFVESIHFEDIATVPQLFLETDKIAFSGEYLYNYFERTGSITRNFTVKGNDMFLAIEKVKTAFLHSEKKNKIDEWKRFYILQGVYSFLAYVARVKDKNLQSEMYNQLKENLITEKISKVDIINYSRFGKNYLLSLSPIKILYYLYAIILKL